MTRTPDPSLLGRKLSVETVDAKVGFEWRQEALWVLPRTSGARLDGEPLLDPKRVRAGSCVETGDTALQIIMGADVEAQYHEIIYRMATARR